MSLKKKLIVIMLLVSFVPLVLLSTVSLRYLSGVLEQETINQSREVTAEAKLQIDGYLDKALTAIKVIAKNPTVQSLNASAIKPFLVQVQKTQPDISFTVDDAKGNQIVRGDNVALVNVWDRAYFQAAFKGSEESISEVLFSKNTNQFVVNLGTPIRQENGAVVGVMQGSIALTKIGEYVKNLSTNGAVVYVIDGGGKVLAHPDANLVKDRFDMSEKTFVKAALASKQNGYAVAEDVAAGKRLVTYAYDPRTGWLICMETPYELITAKTHKLLFILGSITLGVSALVGFLVFYIVRRITQPIVKMQAAATHIAQGDLTQNIEVASNDEIGALAQAFDKMVTNLKNLIRQVQHDASQVASSSEQLTASAEQSAMSANQVASSITEVAQGTEKQLRAVNESAAVAEQMAVNIRQVANNTNAVSQQAAKAAETAIVGGKSVESAVGQMRELEQTVGASAQVVAKLGERSKEIGQIVDTISGIAGQTNLLALNAAIEAARAGEQGRGFAVVAEEVRKLAEQSQDAAKQIAMLIGKIQGETERAVATMGEGTRSVTAGTEVVNAAGNAFQEIIGLVGELSRQVEQISLSMQQLAAGSQHIVKSVQEIDNLSKTTAGEAQTVSAATEEQSAAMQEIASSSQNLGRMAQELQDAISAFRIR